MSSLEELSSFQHYFLHWLGDLHMTDEVVEDMREEMTVSRSPKFAEDADDFSGWRMMTMQSSVAPFLFGFLEIEIGDMDAVIETLEYIKDMLAHLTSKEFMKDYLGGLQFLSRLLNRHYLLVSTQFSVNEPDPDPSFELDKLAQEYMELGPKSQSVLAIAHWMMNETIRDRKGLAVANLKAMVQLDPTNWVWHYLIISRARFLRRSHGDNHNPSSPPSPEEVEAARNAVKYSSYSLPYQLMCTAALSQCLAEIVRAKTNERDFGPITTPAKSYANHVEVVAEIKNAAGEALTEISCGFAEFIRYGEIFSLILPKQYRDYMVAASFMKTACAIAPTNSKVNHKMGSIILIWKKDSQRAAKYLKIAVLADPHNFPAWMELLPAMLSDFKENEPYFVGLFKVFHQLDADWSQTQRGTFAFFEGCVAFLGGKEENAVERWLESISLGEYDGFKQLERIKSRCGWPETHPLTFEAVLESIESFIGVPEQVQHILRLKQIVNRAKEEALIFRSQLRRNSDRNANDGGGGFGGGDTREVRQPRFRSSISNSEADNDMSWRRGSGSQASGENLSSLTEQFRNVGIRNTSGRPGRWVRGSGNVRNTRNP